MPSFMLPESRSSLVGAVQSTFLHTALIASAVWATQSVAEIPKGDRWIDVDVSWRPATTVTPGPVGLGALVEAPVISDIPNTLPPIDPVAVGPLPVDPRTLVPILGRALGTDSTGGPLGSAAMIYQESEVDDVPVLRSAPALRYPRVMAEAGIAGSVTLSFVIDMEGRVAEGSAKVVRTSHEAFIAAAEEAVYGSLFVPAKRRGEAVPVLVRQTVTFRQ
jgi:TonB family protein